MTRDDVLRKVAALLRLAARGGTVDEAATAAAKAQEMMDRYELTASDADAYGQRDADTDEPVVSFYEQPEAWLDNTSARLVQWRWALAKGIGKLHGCYCFIGRRGKGATFEIVGRPGQVESVRYLFSWLVREIEGLITTHGRGMGVVWRREFAEGAASEIVKRLADQREVTVAAVRAEQAGNSTALVRVDRALARMDSAPVAKWAKAHHGLTSLRGGSRRQHDPSARDAGRAAARSIALNRDARRIG